MQGFFVVTKRRAVVGPVYYTLRRPEGSGTGRQAKQATLYVNLLEWLQYAAKTGFAAALSAAWGRLPLPFTFLL